MGLASVVLQVFSQTHRSQSINWMANKISRCKPSHTYGYRVRACSDDTGINGITGMHMRPSVLFVK